MGFEAFFSLPFSPAISHFPLLQEDASARCPQLLHSALCIVGAVAETINSQSPEADHHLSLNRAIG